MRAIDLVRPIEELAPLEVQEKWDNCGFSVGDPYAEVSKALIALDCTEEVVDEAIECGADIIIAHHPLIFGGVKKISPQNWLGRTIIKAIQHNITIYAAHTNMDKAAGEGIPYSRQFWHCGVIAGACRSRRICRDGKGGFWSGGCKVLKIAGGEDYPCGSMRRKRKILHWGCNGKGSTGVHYGRCNLP